MSLRETLLNLPGASFLRHVDYHDELGSTNDRALALASQRDLPLPALILAERQTAGRGRGVNRWWAAEGALTFSLLVELPAELPPERSPLLALVTGLAVCEMLRELLPGEPIGLKWPNDVWLGRRKVCGVLIESPGGPARRTVIGVGLNVNNRFADAPSELRDRATSLYEVAGGPLAMDDVLLRVVRSFERLWSELANPHRDWAERWQPYCVLTGRVVRISQGPRQLVGVCQGIDADGAILVRGESGVVRCHSGIVAGIEPE